MRSLRVIAEVINDVAEDPAAVRRMVSRLMAEMDHLDQVESANDAARRERETQKKREQRARKTVSPDVPPCPRDNRGQKGTEVEAPAKSAEVHSKETADVPGTEKPGIAPLSLSINSLEETKTKREKPARKKPATHCPGDDATPEAVDAWCRGQGLPPASQVPLVAKLIRWHQMHGIPRASWKKTLETWQANERPESATPRPGGFQRPQERDPIAEQREAKRIWAEAKATTQAAYERAMAADRSQAVLAAKASQRVSQAPQSVSAALGVAAPVVSIRQEMTQEQRDAERQRQLRAAMELAALEQKAGGQ